MLNNPDFYPTPRSIIAKMVSPYLYRSNGRLQILEPSAGKGDILDYLHGVHHIKKTDLYCIEKDPELIYTLQGKEYAVIDTDFLSYCGRHQFNLIVMNPPFSNGIDHLMKAWDILAYGDIVCLLNADNVRYPSTAKQRVLENLIEQHGEVEYLDRPFLHAERRTAVDVAMIRLHKERVQSTVNFDGSDFAHDTVINDKEFSANPLAHGDIIHSLVDQYNAASDLIVQIHHLEARKRFYLQGIRERRDDDPEIGSLNEKLTGLKKEFWRYIFDKTKIGQVTTSGYQKKFFDFQAQTSQIAFSVENITATLRMFFDNRFEIMEECLIEVFDTATKYHEKNKVHTEGWKTNKSWKVARKIIMPNSVEYDQRFNSWSYAWKRKDFFDDMDRVCCMLTGKKFNKIQNTYDTVSHRLSTINREDVPYTELVYSEFFKIRFFKKGTIHLEFLDEQLWENFNARAAQGKNWVGPGY